MSQDSKLKSELESFGYTENQENVLDEEMLELVAGASSGGAFYKRHTKYIKPPELNES